MLSSYRVIDCTDERGQLAGFMLAQLGADVLLVEPPGGSSARRCPPFAGDRAGLGHEFVALGVQPRQALGGRGPHDGRRSIAPRRSRRGRRRPAVDRPAERDAVHLRRSRRGQPTLGRRGAHTVRTRRTQGELGGDRPRRERGRLRGRADRRCGPSPVALGFASGVLARCGRYGRRGRWLLWQSAGDPAAVNSSTSRRRFPAPNPRSATPSIRPGARRTMRRCGDGLDYGNIKLQWTYPAADGAVSITFSFGEALAHFTREPVPVDLGGRWLRRGDARHTVDRAESRSCDRGGVAIGDRPVVRGDRRLHRHPHPGVSRGRGGATAGDVGADLEHRRGDGQRPSGRASVLGRRPAAGL